MPYVVTDKILFLSSASKILSSSLDYHSTLKNVAELIVESVADFCMIDILEEDDLRRVVVKISDHRKDKLAQKFYDFPPDPKNKSAIYDAARKRRPIIIKQVTDTWLSKVSRFDEEKNLVKKLNFSSFIFVPLESRHEVIGVMTIGSTEKNFTYSEDDGIFIKELADRAGITVDKAKLYSEAQDAIRARDEFLAVASHELKTPLTSVLLSLQLVLRKLEKSTIKIDASEEVIKAVEVGIQQSKRMSRLINDLLDVSETSSEYFHIYKEEVNLSELIKDIELKFEIILKEKKIKLTVKEEDKNIKGYWDKIRLEQAISNLIANAIKYGNGKPINVLTKKTDSGIEIKVKDKGKGIIKEDRSRIFKVFNRGSDVKDYKGIGVGLFLTKQIIEAHGGEIGLFSKEGEGSVFTIKLPIK